MGEWTNEALALENLVRVVTMTVEILGLELWAGMFASWRGTHSGC